MTNLSEQVPVPPRNFTKRTKLTPKERAKRILARATAKMARTRGRLEKKSCFVCESPANLEFHHPNYDEALDVITVCHRDHQSLTHGRLSLIPRAVEAYLQVNKALRMMNQQMAIAAAVRRIRKACGDVTL